MNSEETEKKITGENQGKTRIKPRKTEKNQQKQGETRRKPRDNQEKTRRTPGEHQKKP